jgi:putative transcriptional regulator
MRPYPPLFPVLSCLVMGTMMFSAAGSGCAAENMANAVFLVASRGLADPNFRETVVLVTHPQQGGPWGVIINRPLPQRLSEIITDHEQLKSGKDVLHFGGPVVRQGLVFLVRTSNPPAGATAFLGDVYSTADTAWIDDFLARGDTARRLRVFAGYSGWGQGQLQIEIKRRGWHLVPADAETIFDKAPARIWPELIERATTKHTRWGRETGNVNRGTSSEVEPGFPIHDSRFTIHEEHPTVVPMLAEAHP